MINTVIHYTLNPQSTLPLSLMRCRYVIYPVRRAALLFRYNAGSHG